jgi:serine O-acetyltransferase
VAPTGTSGRREPSAARTAFRADLARYGAHPFLREWSVYAVGVYRFGQWNDGRRGISARVLDRVYWLGHRLAIAVTHVELPKEAQVGPGLRIHHSGPVVVHPGVVIGPDCTLRHGVTIGERRSGGGCPVLGSSVELGAYSQVLGRITLGDHVKVGAMALVLDDVPDHGVAVAPRATIR